ncbi:9111_t:CDS:2 [Rhizophagus irregularis]|nr:9111_t:CDS:2 [Rhizophagus irregularis]
MTELNFDCLTLIFDELRTDKKSLHSCLFVNKKWCNIVVPILWKYSLYNLSEQKEEKIFNIILSCLPLSSKQLLLVNDIKLSSKILLNTPTFNYISFCKFPENEVIRKIIEMVLGDLTRYYKRNILEQEIYKLFVSQCKNIGELRWQTLQPLSLFPGASTCFSQLYNLFIDVFSLNSDTLYEMAKFCKNLNSLSIHNFSKDLPGLVSLIDAQVNLRRVNLCTIFKGGNCEDLSKALTRKCNTISYLSFNSIGTIPPSFLSSLVNLKWLSIFNNEDYEDIEDDIKELQKYLAISEFPNLQYLNINGLSCFKELSIYLKTIRFDSLDFFMDENDNNIGDELLDILISFSPKCLNDITVSKSWKFSINTFERFFESFRDRPLHYFYMICHGRSYITEEHKIMVKQYIEEGVIKYSSFS